MKKLVKLIGICTFVSGTAGLVYSITKANKLKNDNQDVEQLEANGKNLVRKCIFDGLEEKIDMSDKDALYLIGRFGGMELDLNKTSEDNEDITVDIDMHFGGIELKVPEGYEIVNNISCIMGGVEIPETQSPEGDPVITLTGKVVFGGVEVQYQSN